MTAFGGMSAILNGDTTITSVVIVLLCAYLAVYWWRKANKKKELKRLNALETSDASEAFRSRREIKNRASISTVVAAVTKQPYKDNIKKMIDEEKDFLDKDELWEGMTNTEIAEWDDYVSEIPVIEGSEREISLIPEPDNPYDSNAIRVVHSKYGEFGYVPANTCERVHAFINENPDYAIRWYTEGGRHKYFDGEKVRIESEPNYIRLKLYKFEDQ